MEDKKYKNQESLIAREHKVRTYKPWGYYEVLHTDVCPHTKLETKVKKFVVNPGEELSVQKHEYREETWKVISGKGLVTIGNPNDLHSHHSYEIGINFPYTATLSIPVNTIHHVKNEQDIPLMIIEIQHGIRCSEDDITRYSDKYDR